MTRLFQNRDPVLRRMVYLGIKELSHIAEDVIIVTSSLTKDMTGKEDHYRVVVIRSLCTIIYVSLLIIYNNLCYFNVYHFYFVHIFIPLIYDNFLIISELHASGS